MNISNKNLWLNLSSKDKYVSGKCPSALLLAQYIDGNATDEILNNIEKHLEKCDKCLDIVTQIKLSQRKKSLVNNVFIKIASIAAILIIIGVVIIMSIEHQEASENKYASFNKAERIIELYNSNQYYTVNKSSIDGFAPSSFPAPINMTHEADINANGKISMNEVLLYIMKLKGNKQIALSN